MNEKNTGHKGMLDTVIDSLEKSKSERLHAASDKALTAAAEREKENEEYRKKLHREKIELLKAKQGITDGSEFEAKEEKKEYTFFQKVGAFFYCNKPLIVIGSFFVLLAGFLGYDYIRRPDPDFTVMVLSCSYEMNRSCEKLEEIINEYTDDMNGNGDVLASVYYMPLCDMTDQVNYDDEDEKTGTEKNVVNAESASEPEETAAVTEKQKKSQDIYTQQASSSKLFTLMQTGDTIMVISDTDADIFLLPDQTLEDLEALYPGNEHVKGHGFYLSGTKFAEETGYEGEVPEDLYIGLRKVQKGSHYRDEMQKNYDEAKKILDALVERFS
ncbi:MAG: hypothetical protein IKN85_14240 [Oscillospiraceae bacterium]|nr:hypothetical protein [Oscillospiraceae bacterium]MBR3536978.1 hypothetical protein [Oscillospiraceae bacterium]MBR6836723.1 hypothetical protein [Oscillospiraceae bacterium]